MSCHPSQKACLIVAAVCPVVLVNENSRRSAVVGTRVDVAEATMRVPILRQKSSRSFWELLPPVMCTTCIP